MEEVLREFLEEGEQLIWMGGSTSKKIMDSTYRVPYLLRFLISYGLTIFVIYYAIKTAGTIKVSVLLFLLIVGSMIPMVAIADGLKVRTLCYAATDRRLLKVNGSMSYSVRYDEIGRYEFREDPSGNESLLCGKEAIKSKPAKWRSAALSTGTIEKDENNHVTDYVFYAVDDSEGLKKVLEERV